MADILTLAADIVSAHVKNNTVDAERLPEMIRSVFNALSNIDRPVVAETLKEPAVPIRKSVTPDYLVCLEDGKKLKMLKRYLMTNFEMTPDEYRQKWGLPPDYPMVAPNYATRRSALAKEAGLGRSRSVTPDVTPIITEEEDDLTEEPVATKPTSPGRRTAEPEYIDTDLEEAPPPKPTRGRPRRDAPPRVPGRRGRPPKS